MPFGLKIGPYLFQRFLNEVIAKLIRTDNVVVYMDDILIATETIELHSNVLKEVFAVLVENKLELRLEKCAFMYTEIKYLRYRTFKEGIQPTNRGSWLYKTSLNPESLKNFNLLSD